MALGIYASLLIERNMNEELHDSFEISFANKP
jgi:hypothetical protein